MKWWLIIWLLLGGVLAAHAQTTSPGATGRPTNESSRLDSSGLDSPGLDSPRLLLPHRPLPLITDSAYLISPARYRFYRQLHRYVLDSTAQAGDSLIVSYAQSLQATQAAYDTLLRQYQTSDRLATQSLRSTQLTLGQLGRTLDQTQYALTQTARSLNEAEDQLRIVRHRSFMQRVAYGAGGVGVGLLIGLLVR